MIKRSYIIVLGILFNIFLANVLLAPSTSAVTADGGSGTKEPVKGLDPSAQPYRLNRMTLSLGNYYFYDSDTTDNDWTFYGVGLKCPAQIDFQDGPNELSQKWILTYQKERESGGGCTTKNTEDISKPSNWDERRYVVFAGGEAESKIISVKPDSNISFKKGSTYNGNTVYIQENVDPYSCPLVIRKNKNWVLIPLEKKSSEDDVSNQIRTLFDKELRVGDTDCGPTDNDDLGIFSQFGLPESYYDAGTEEDHYLETDFGFEGKKVGGADLGGLGILPFSQAAGIALNGPLKGGGYDPTNPTGGQGSVGDEDSTRSTCDIDGVGWIICPVMNFLATLNDSAFGLLNNLLTIKPALLQDEATRKAWEKFRDLANVMFIIAFLFIIYSQITSAGISNYGIKRLLPKMIVAAILVNTSYYITQIAVDLSNITGAGVYDLFKSVADDAALQKLEGADGGAWQTIMGGLLVGAGIIFLVVAVILAPSVLLAFAVVLLILVARQAFAILLVVVSPLAFVAYMLPNTESWFKKWWKAFSAVLMVFPVVGLIFGASTLASSILMGVAGDGTSKGGDDETLLSLVALGVLAVPLFTVPTVLKGALSAAGSMGGKIAGLQDRANRRGMKGIKQGRLGEAKAAYDARAAQNKVKRRLNGGYIGKGRIGSKLAAYGETRGGVIGKALQVAGAPGKAIDESRAAGYLGADQGLARAQAKELERYNEEVKQQKSTMSEMSHADLMSVVKDKRATEERRAAAAGTIASRSYRAGHQELLDYVGDSGTVGVEPKVMKTIQQQTAYDLKDAPTGLGDGDKSALAEGKLSISGGTNLAGTKRTVSQETMLKKLEAGKLTAQGFATLNPDDLSLIENLKTNGHLTPAAQASIDRMIDTLREPANATIYAAAKDNAVARHNALHS